MTNTILCGTEFSKTKFEICILKSSLLLSKVVTHVVLVLKKYDHESLIVAMSRIKKLINL